MGLVIDLIIIMFICACVFFGYKKGLVKLGIHLISFIVAILITFILYRPIGDLVIKYTNIDESIQNVVSSKIDSKDEENKKEKIEIIEKSKDKLLSEVSITLSYNIIYVSVMIILFVVSKIVLFFASTVLDIVAKLPVLEQFNKAGGILYGILVGFFVVYLILLIISFAVKINVATDIYKIIENTHITKLLYENNILRYFFLIFLVIFAIL